MPSVRCACGLAAFACVVWVLSVTADEPPARVPRAILDLALESVPPNTNPGKEYTAATLDYAMVIGIDRTPKGRLWAAWVAGGDSEKGLFVAASSDDDGATWTEPRLVIDPKDAPTGLARRALVGNFWTDPAGRLWLFYDQSMGYFDGRGGVWAITCDDPDADKPVWSAPRRIWHGATLNKPTILKDSDWLLPVSLWTRNKIGPAALREEFRDLDDLRMANVFASSDKGKTWERRGGVKVPESDFDEHTVVELKDGRLWLLARTTYGLAESFSSDKGNTWTDPKPSAIKHTNARVFLRRLSSGKLLLVKHGKIDERTPKRSHLTAFLSDDDGKTWKGGLVIDEREGVSYPDGFQAPDGSISVIYDHNRAKDREILLARFTEDDILAGKFASPRAKARMLVHKALGVNWSQQATADAKQDRTMIVYDGKKPNSMVCDTTLRQLPDGSWVLFFLAGGDKEPSPDNYTAVARSTDQGKTWSATKAFDVGFPREGDTIGQGPTEVLVVGNRTSLFFSTHAKHWSTQWRSWVIHSDDSGKTWTKPEPLPGRLKERTFIRQHLVTRDGRILLPFQHYIGPNADKDKPPLDREFTNPRLGVLASSDGGKTWTEHGDVKLTDDDRYFGWAEPTLAETADGRIVMLIRADKLGGVLYSVESKDGGKTWPALAVKTDIPNPGSKATLFTLGVNAVALLHNPNPDHRSPLALWISFDGLKTWPYRRVLVAESSDGPKGRLNYPDGFVSKNRQWLHFAYDDNRHRAVFYSAKLPPLPTDDPALAAPTVNTSPGPEYADRTRIFQGIPGIERAKNGRLWATWYAGGPDEPGEGPGNYVTLVTSGDDGKTWSGPKLVIDPPGQVRAYDPCLWTDPDGRLWLFWAQSFGWWDGRSGVWAITTDKPGDETPTWSAPRRLMDGIMMNKPTIRSTGDWLFLVAVWERKADARTPADRRHEQGAASGANVWGTTDKGKTFAQFEQVQVPKRVFDEHMLVERKGGELWMLVRAAYGIGESTSVDGGKTWTAGKETTIPHVNSRFFVRRLSSGKLLLVTHEPPDKKSRSHLTGPAVVGRREDLDRWVRDRRASRRVVPGRGRGGRRHDLPHLRFRADEIQADADGDVHRGRCRRRQDHVRQGSTASGREPGDGRTEGEVKPCPIKPRHDGQPKHSLADWRRQPMTAFSSSHRLAVFVCLLWAQPTIAADPSVSRIAFGSCAKQDKPQPIWDAVIKTKPEHFVFLGDNIYADTEDMDVMKAKYALLGKQPGYIKLKAACPIHATWDDHDYGGNDAGAEYPKKKESQQVFLDFFEVPKDDPRRSREGVYSSRVFGPEGKRVQLILLDARYFRSPLKKGFKPGEPGDGLRGIYVPNTDKDTTVLGEAQWKWLAEQLKVPAELRLIGSGVQAVPDEHGSEMWGNFPLERKRLFELIRETRANGVVFLTGDRHLAEISRLPADHADGVGYPLFDVCSSSLNVPSGNMTKSGVRFANQVNSYRVGLTYFDINFGTVLIDWEPADPVIRLQVREEKGDVILQQRLTLSQLRAKPKP